MQPTSATNWLDRAILAFAPGWGLERLQARAAARIMLSYEAGRMGRRTQGWMAPPGSADELISQNGETLRNRAREMVRNHPLAGRIVMTLANRIVGYGHRIRLESERDSQSRIAQEAFEEWAELEADPAGVGDLNGAAWTAARCMLESGEVLARYRTRRLSDGMRIPLQVQILEPDWIDNSRSEGRGTSNNSNYRVEGIEYSAIGRRTGYWLYRVHPGGMSEASPPQMGYTESRLVPAAEISHLFLRLRPEQSRGVTILAPVMLAMRDLDDWADAERVRKKVAATMGVFIKVGGGTNTAMGEQETDSQTGRVTETLRPGMIRRLKPGEDPVLLTPPADSGRMDFITSELVMIAAGVNLQYSTLTGDTSLTNYTGFKAGDMHERRLVEVLQWLFMIPMFYRPLARKWLEHARLAGVIPMGERIRISFTPPKLESVDPDREARATLARIRAGVKPPQDAIEEETGEPWRDVLDKYGEWNRAIDEKNLILDSDPRKVSQSGQQQGSGAEATADAARDQQD